MTTKTDRDRLRVTAMIQAAEEAKLDAAVGKEEFLEGGRSQKAVLLDLIHLTESADKASLELKKLNPRIPWERLNGLRNRGLVHDYAEIDLDQVWAFVRDDLSRLRRQLDHTKFPRDDDR